MLQERYNLRDSTDPLILDSVDDSNEWLIGEMKDDLVFEGDTLTWGDVEEASGFIEPFKNTRQQGRMGASTSSSQVENEYRDRLDLEASEDEIEGHDDDGEADTFMDSDDDATDSD